MTNNRPRVLLNEIQGYQSDQDAIRRALNGDHDGFRLLVEKYQADVATTVNAMLGPGAEAEDVGQETFIRFYESLGRFRGESSVRTYLKRIAINLSLNALDKRKRRLRHIVGGVANERRQGLDAGEQASSDGRLLDDAVSDEPLPDMRLVSSERAAIVHNALLELSDEHRAVVALRMIDGYSTEETAAMLKIPVGTVLSRLARATARLKELLKQTL